LEKQNAGAVFAFIKAGQPPSRLDLLSTGKESKNAACCAVAYPFSIPAPSQNQVALS